MLEPASLLAPVALIENPAAPEAHWRIVRPFTRLRQQGVDARFYWQDNARIATDPATSILVLPQMTSASPEQAQATLDQWRPAVRAIVYETDDDVWTDERIEHLKAADYLQGKTVDEIRHEQDIARWFIDHVDGVTVSTEALAAVARSFTRTPVQVVPNALDVRWFTSQMSYRPQWSDILTIGWAGGRRSERDLVPMAHAWGRIAKRYAHVYFVIAAPTTLTVVYRSVPESRIIRLPWLGLEDYPLAHQVDIGCCSVRDTPFNRCRSPIKTWEYATAGAAVVASPTVYGECVGGNGRLAETADEWEAALVHLIEDAAHRSKHAAYLREHVERHHCLDSQLHTWTDAYAAIVESTAGGDGVTCPTCRTSG